MKNMRTLRKHTGKTLTEMAMDLRTSQQVLNRYELGQSEPDFQMVFTIADYFGVSIDYLLGRDFEQSDNIHKTNLLSSKEESLLTSFRTCNSTLQADILAYAKGVANTYIKLNGKGGYNE